VGVEVAAARVAHILQELDQEEGRLRLTARRSGSPGRSGRGLVVEVDVEELAGLPGLGHVVQEVQPGHVLVGHLGVDAHHLRVVERVDEASMCPVVGVVDVAARLVGLGLQGET
jgi:endonuclease III